MAGLSDWLWRKPMWCRMEREHVPDPADLFQPDAECLRCGRSYDDGAAQAHRLHRIAAQTGGKRRSPTGYSGQRRKLADDR